MKKKDIYNHGEGAFIVREKITKRQAMILVDHAKGRIIFEYDDSSERRDQLRNAYMLGQQMLDKKEISSVIDYVTNPDMPKRVQYRNGNPVIQ